MRATPAPGGEYRHLAVSERPWNQNGRRRGRRETVLSFLSTPAPSMKAVWGQEFGTLAIRLTAKDRRVSQGVDIRQPDLAVRRRSGRAREGPACLRPGRKDFRQKTPYTEGGGARQDGDQHLPGRRRYGSLGPPAPSLRLPSAFLANSRLQVIDFREIFPSRPWRVCHTRPRDTLAREEGGAGKGMPS